MQYNANLRTKYFLHFLHLVKTLKNILGDEWNLGNRSQWMGGWMKTSISFISSCLRIRRPWPMGIHLDIGTWLVFSAWLRWHWASTVNTSILSTWLPLGLLICTAVADWGWESVQRLCLIMEFLVSTGEAISSWCYSFSSSSYIHQDLNPSGRQRMKAPEKCPETLFGN